MAAGEVLTRLVCGTGSAEEFITAWLNLAEPAQEILEWRKSVDIENATVVPGGVLLSGRLRTRCLYATPDGESESPGNPERGARRVREKWGRMLYHSAEVDFVVRVPVPGAQPGMEATVTEAYVIADASAPRWELPAGQITGVFDQSLVGLAVRVTEWVFAQVHMGEGQAAEDAQSGEPVPKKARTPKKGRRRSRRKRSN